MKPRYVLAVILGAILLYPLSAWPAARLVSRKVIPFGTFIEVYRPLLGFRLIQYVVYRGLNEDSP